MSKFILSLIDRTPFGKTLKKVSEVVKIHNDDEWRFKLMRKASKNSKFMIKNNLMNKPHLRKSWIPKVSIFCLTYNQQETIDKTISSF